jgi:transposase InsO family protein
MKADVESFKQCNICQHTKHGHSHPARLLQPLPIPAGVWQDLSMDFTEGLPKSKAYSVILVVVDRLTKFSHFLPLKHPYNAHTVAQLFLDNVVKLHGLPNSIVTDRDSIFVSVFWKQLFKLYKVNLTLSTAYHPQTNGQTERVNQGLEMYLRCLVQDSPKTWKAWLSLAELWYNSSFHSSLGCSPFKALYGYEPNLGAHTLPGSETSAAVADIIVDRELHLQLLKQRLEQA